MSSWRVSRRLAWDVAREVVLVLLCGAGAWLFMNHTVLYLRGDPLPAVSPEAYVLTASVLYLFIRSVSLVAGPPAPARGEVRCPECGWPIPKGAAPDLRMLAATPPPERRTPAPEPSTRTVRRAWRPPWMTER